MQGTELNAYDVLQERLGGVHRRHPAGRDDPRTGEAAAAPRKARTRIEEPGRRAMPRRRSHDDAVDRRGADRRRPTPRRTPTNEGSDA